MDTLPPELLISIFCHLDLWTLDQVVPRVCRRWNHVVSDQELWRHAFETLFHTLSFHPLVKSSWRNEYIDRLNLLQRWRKNSSLHKSYFVSNDFLSHLLLDFSNDKLVLLSDNSGTVNITHLPTGKQQSLIPVFSPTVTCCHSLSLSSLVTGTFEGVLYVKLLSTRSYTENVIELQNSPHISAITAILSSDTLSGIPGVATCISGDVSGLVTLWDLHSFKSISTIKFDSAVQAILSNFKDVLIVKEHHQINIVHINLLNPGSHQVQSIPSIAGKIICDYGSEQIIVYDEEQLIVYSYKDQTKKHFTPLSGQISHVLIDDNCNRSIDHSVATVGRSGCLIAVVVHDRVVVFNIRALALTPIVTIRPKFHKELPVGIGIQSVTITPVLVLVGTFNGYCYIHDVLTGEALRVASVRIPRRLLPIEYNIPVAQVLINPDPHVTNGVLICGNVVQYFQFGDLVKETPRKTKRNIPTLDRKNAIQREINNELKELEDIKKLESRFGHEDNDEAESLELAMLISASLQHDRQLREDEELLRLIQLSLQDL